MRIRMQLGQHGDEFITAEATDQVAGTHAGLQPARNFLQHQVASTMSVGVINGLEAVEVEEHHRQLVLVPARAADQLRADFIDQCAIGQAGQGVVLRGMAQFFFGAFAISDVGHKAHTHPAFGGVGHRDQRLDGKQLAIFAPPLQVQPVHHRPLLRFSEKLAPVPRMRSPLRRIQQHFDGLADQFALLVAEHAVRGLVRDANDPVITYAEDALRRGLEQRTHGLLVQCHRVPGFFQRGQQLYPAFARALEYFADDAKHQRVDTENHDQRHIGRPRHLEAVRRLDEKIDRHHHADGAGEHCQAQAAIQCRNRGGQKIHGDRAHIFHDRQQKQSQTGQPRDHQQHHQVGLETHQSFHRGMECR